LNADVDGSGLIDAGDYVLWRKSLAGQSSAIANGSAFVGVPEVGVLPLAAGAIMIGLMDARSLCMLQH
jgi:hypothetical protein